MRTVNSIVEQATRRILWKAIHSQNCKSEHVVGEKTCAKCEPFYELLFPQGWSYYPGDVCEHGVYVGGVGADYMCLPCEMGDEYDLPLSILLKHYGTAVRKALPAIIKKAVSKRIVFNRFEDEASLYGVDLLITRRALFEDEEPHLRVTLVFYLGKNSLGIRLK